MNSGLILPEQGTRITRMFGGYCIRLTPARSAPAYEHQLQRNATIFGCQSACCATSLMMRHSVRLPAHRPSPSEHGQDLLVPEALQVDGGGTAGGRADPASLAHARR